MYLMKRAGWVTLQLHKDLLAGQDIFKILAIGSNPLLEDSIFYITYNIMLSHIS